MATPARAADAADRAARAADAEYADMAERFGDVIHRTAEAVRDNTTPPPSPVRSRNAERVLMFGCQDKVVATRWRRSRVVYTFDADLARELADSDPDDVIPGGLPRSLPHPDPYLAFPEPVTLPVHGGEQHVLNGAFLYGVTDRREMSSTADPRAVTFGFLFGGPILTPSGRPSRTDGGYPDYGWSRITLHPEPQTMGALIDGALRRFTSATALRTGGLPDADDIVPRMIRMAVPMLVYLCATNADTRPAPAVAVKRRPDGSPWAGKPPRVVEVGFHVGPALGAARRAHATRATSAPTGRRMRPHVRRAHWHTYRVGPGRAETRLRWLPPIPIHADEAVDRTTVVPVTTRKD